MITHPINWCFCSAAAFRFRTRCSLRCSQVSFLDVTFGPDLSKRIQALYPLSAYATPWHVLEMIDGDVSFACPSRRSARWLSAGSAAQTVYLYHFVHAPEITAPDKHVLCCHSCELAFVFHYDTGLITPGERALSSNLASLWTAFGTNHAPANGSTWPEHGASDQNIVFDATAFDSKLSVQSGLKQVMSSATSAHVHYLHYFMHAILFYAFCFCMPHFILSRNPFILLHALNIRHAIIRLSVTFGMHLVFPVFHLPPHRDSVSPPHDVSLRLQQFQ
jgi:hypothetical protein